MSPGGSEEHMADERDPTTDVADKERSLEDEERKIQEHAPEERSPSDRADADLTGDDATADPAAPPGNPEPRG
jgi:hypothetical protein